MPAVLNRCPASGQRACFQLVVVPNMYIGAGFVAWLQQRVIIMLAAQFMEPHKWNCRIGYRVPRSYAA